MAEIEKVVVESGSDSEPEVVPVTDAMKLSRENVEKAKQDDSGKVYRVYCDGVFDLFHVGHMLMLKQAKLMLGAPEKTFLICGVCSDEDTQKYKGKTVMDHKTRCLSCENCKWVDLVAPDAPWVITEDFLQKYQIDFVAHDAIPYTDTTGSAEDASDVYGFVKKKGMFMETQRTEGISTSDLILDLVCDYDQYVERNLQRGYTPEQLNLGPIWKLKVKERKKRQNVKEKYVKTKDTMSHVSASALQFVRLFDPRHKGTIKAYSSNISTNVVGHGKAMFRDIGTAIASLPSYFASLLSYCNIFSYFPKKVNIGVSVVVAMVGTFLGVARKNPDLIAKITAYVRVIVKRK